MVLAGQSGVVYFSGSYDSPSFVYTNNMSAHKTYGVKGDSTAIGTATLTAYTVNSLFAANVLAGGKASSYPSGNFFPNEAQWRAEFVDYAGGNYRLLDTSVYKTAGTDGTALGANIDQVEAAAALAARQP